MQGGGCDGAVLATSILRGVVSRRRMVGNLDHVWVAVDNTELMAAVDKNYARTEQA